MHKLIRSCLCLMILTVTCNVSAKIYKWPVITGVDIKTTGSSKVNYVISIGYDLLPESSATNDKVKECNSSCMLRLAFRKMDIATGKDAPLIFTFPDAASPWQGVTWKTLLEATNKLTATSTTKDTYSGIEGNQCVDVGILPISFSGDNATWSQWLSTRVAPPGVTPRCFGFPPVNQWCALTTPSVSFNFGYVRLQDAVGVSQTADVNVECTMGMKYVLKLKGLDHIQLDNGMVAKFTANGKALGEPLDGLQGKVNPVKLEATLQGTLPADGGDFSGASVLSVSYP